MQLNSLVDLIIPLGTHLKNKNTHISNSNMLLINLDYIKTQNNDILKSIGLTKNNSNYFKALDNKCTKILQLLDEIKQLIIT